MKKGDIVEINAKVKGRSCQSKPPFGWQFLEGDSEATHYRNIYRRLLDEPVKGIIIGYSFIQTGRIEGGATLEGEYEAYIPLPKFHQVWVVEPLTHGERYIEPYRVLEEDLTQDRKKSRIEG